MSKCNPIVLTLSGMLLLASGIVFGAWFGPQVEPLLATDRFIARRMAECGLTVRLHELAVAQGDARLQRLVAGDMVGCGWLVSTYRDRIALEDRDTAARISAFRPSAGASG